MNPHRVKAFTYVTRLPPSPSGVAVYADAFRRVLETLAPTDVLLLPAAPTDSQRSWTLITTLVRATAALRRERDRVLYFELAGRGLAEFWAAYILTRRPWRRRVWLTLHDAPSICGGTFYFRLLDRRGGRELAERLSRSMGRRAERALLQDAERVYCLSEEGTHLIAATFDLTRPVMRLPHVATASRSPVEERRSIFIPGYINGVENIAPVLRALAKAPLDWQVEIGACGQRTASDAKRLARELAVDGRLSLLGYVDEEQQRNAFERAALVVRWRRSGWATNGSPGSAAVSGPLIHAMAHGAAVLTNDSRGIAECLSDAGALELASGDEGAQALEDSVVALVENSTRRAAMASAGRKHILREHDSSHIVQLLREA